jgi:hypothetical protein
VTQEEDVVATLSVERRSIRGLPLWYLVLAGVLVASYDVCQEFPPGSSARTLVPLGILALHLGLWFGVLRRRMRYTRAVLRSPKARALAIVLVLVRVALGLALTQLYTGAYEHLVLGVIMLVVVPASAWCDQWLILRALRREDQSRVVHA